MLDVREQIRPCIAPDYDALQRCGEVVLSIPLAESEPLKCTEATVNSAGDDGASEVHSVLGRPCSDRHPRLAKNCGQFGE